MKIDLETAIKEATVFLDRARITRTGKVSVEPGSHQVVIGSLPLALETESVRVRAHGTARAKILGVDVKRAFFKKIPPGDARELEDKLQDVKDRERELADRADAIAFQMKHLDGMADATQTYAAGLAKGRSSIESYGKLLDFIHSRLKTQQELLRNNVIHRRNLENERKQLENQLKQIHNAKPKERYEAIVDIDVQQAGDLEFRLVYMFFGAHWKPLYDIRLLEKKVEINYFADVNQSSGESWEGISLTLSTARPSASTTVPELSPWYLFPLRPATRAAGGPPMAAAPMPAAMKRAKAKAPGMGEDTELLAMGALAEAESYDAGVVTAEVSQTDTFVTYNIGEKINLPGDGSPHKNTIGVFHLEPNFEYVTAPKLETAAYRLVKSKNDSPYLLLPGKAQLFIADDYIGAIHLELTAPNETLKLYFGTDDRIRVKRELINRETDKKFMADKRILRYAYEIKLENHTGEPQNITVHDQIPVPRHENIKVKLEETNPKITGKDELQRLKWNLNLKAAETRQLRYNFSIEYPRDMKIQGLP